MTSIPMPVTVLPLPPDKLAIHLFTPDGKPIRGALEHIPACSEIANLHIGEDDTLGFEFGGWQEQWFEDRHPAMRRHPETQREGFILVDFEGHEHHENDLLRCLPDARRPAPQLPILPGPSHPGYATAGMTPTQQLRRALHEEQAHRVGLETGIRKLLVHLASPGTPGRATANATSKNRSC